ncbi:MAG: SAM-dependent methyltransferase [Chloroflexi bacterium]|nr:SAM-dependent methyltransferase [Chloroflexota bacterium]
MSADPLGLRRVDVTPAARLIAEEIRREGPITFSRYMEICLHHPEVGYYAGTARGPGRDKDFITSPELHPAFGALVCKQLEAFWKELGSPDPYWFIEGGPGNGTLAADVLSTAGSKYPKFLNALRVALIERNPLMEARQRERLTAWGDGVSWIESDPEAWEPLGTGCVFSNELLDTFPSHRLKGGEEGPRELYVDIEDGRFVEIEGPLSSSALRAQLEAGGGTLRPGSLAEVSLEAPRWVPAASRLLERGHLLTLDYGEPANLLYGSRHPRGTLRCYRGQVMTEDVYDIPGQQDITLHIDLSAVTRAAQAAGLSLVGMTQQGAFLKRLGLQDFVHRASNPSLPREEQRAQLAALELLRDPSALGSIAVLVFGKGL